MKKKNGFIATSLIYTFFLAFITLFLGVVADYLQQKVLLNAIEEGIKEEINNQISLSDLEGKNIYKLDNCIDIPNESNKADLNQISNNSIIHKCSKNTEDLCINTNNVCIVVQDR